MEIRGTKAYNSRIFTLHFSWVTKVNKDLDSSFIHVFASAAGTRDAQRLNSRKNSAKSRSNSFVVTFENDKNIISIWLGLNLASYSLVCLGGLPKKYKQKFSVFSKSASTMFELGIFSSTNLQAGICQVKIADYSALPGPSLRFTVRTLPHRGHSCREYDLLQLTSCIEIYIVSNNVLVL